LWENKLGDHGKSRRMNYTVKSSPVKSATMSVRNNVSRHEQGYPLDEEIEELHARRRHPMLITA
jgi:hypothetical protein